MFLLYIIVISDIASAVKLGLNTSHHQNTDNLTLNQVQDFLLDLQLGLKYGQNVLQGMGFEEIDGGPPGKGNFVNRAVSSSEGAASVMRRAPENSFSDGFLRLLKLAIKKDPDDVMEVLKHGRPLTIMMEQSGRSKMLRGQLAEELFKFLHYCQFRSYEEIQPTLMNILRHITSRVNMLNSKINQVIDAVDSMMKPEDRKRLEKVLNDFEKFPEVNITGEQLCENILEAFLGPIRVKTGTLEFKSLIALLEQVPKVGSWRRSFIGKNLSSGSDDDISCTPNSMKMEAEAAINNIVPESSKERYLKTYDEIMKDITPETSETDDLKDADDALQDLQEDIQKSQKLIQSLNLDKNITLPNSNLPVQRALPVAQAAEQKALPVAQSAVQRAFSVTYSTVPSSLPIVQSTVKTALPERSFIRPKLPVLKSPTNDALPVAHPAFQTALPVFKINTKIALPVNLPVKTDLRSARTVLPAKKLFTTHHNFLLATDKHKLPIQKKERDGNVHKKPSKSISYTGALIKFLGLLQHMDDHNIQLIFQRTNRIAQSMVDKGELRCLGRLRPIVVDGLGDFIASTKADELKEYASTLRKKLTAIKTHYSREVRDVIEFTNEFINDTYAEQLDSVLSEMERFPKVNKTGDKLCHDLIKAFTQPFEHAKKSFLYQNFYYDVYKLLRKEYKDYYLRTVPIKDGLLW